MDQDSGMSISTPRSDQVTMHVVPNDPVGCCVAKRHLHLKVTDAVGGLSSELVVEAGYRLTIGPDGVKAEPI
jgi:propanediol utilization protein